MTEAELEAFTDWHQRIIRDYAEISGIIERMKDFASTADLPAAGAAYDQAQMQSVISEINTLKQVIRNG